ncbi:hypothetical protein STANM309S_05864 [Streptomyces tanashiensis]
MATSPAVTDAFLSFSQTFGSSGGTVAGASTQTSRWIRPRSSSALWAALRTSGARFTRSSRLWRAAVAESETSRAVSRIDLPLFARYGRTLSAVPFTLSARA